MHGFRDFAAKDLVFASNVFSPSYGLKYIGSCSMNKGGASQNLKPQHNVESLNCKPESSLG